MNNSTMSKTSCRISPGFPSSVHRLRWRNLFSPPYQKADDEEAKNESPNVGEVRHAPACAGRGRQPGRAEHGLDREPDPEHHVSRDLDHREEKDDEHERQDTRPWIQHDVGTEDPGDRPGC